MLMKIFQRATVKKNERALLLRNGSFDRVLHSGTYWLFAGTDQLRVETFALEQPAFTHGLAEYLMAQEPAVVAAEFVHVNLSETEVGLRSENGVLVEILPPGTRRLYWKGLVEVSVQVVDLRLQAVEVSGQDIMTRDKVSLRLNLCATYRFVHVLQAYGQLQKPADHLYRELQFALRAAVGTRTLDELLENKTVIDEVVTAHMAAKLQPSGMQLESVGVKDIVLPGEMKTILTQVVQAQKQAEANVIRRREETAATRSLLNTAKVMEDNPVALRMKELETLERVAERIDKISVFGGLDQVLNGLVKMR